MGRCSESMKGAFGGIGSSGILTDCMIEDEQESHYLSLSVSATLIEQHEGIKMAFQNSHRLVVFRTDQLESTYQAFIVLSLFLQPEVIRSVIQWREIG
jgi:hypothetical protein